MRIRSKTIRDRIDAADRIRAAGDNTAAFVLGYQFGKNEQRELSRREAEQLHPEFSYEDIGRFVQGNIDGVMGDSFRYNLALDKFLELPLQP